MKKKLAILLSGNGTTFENIHLNSEYLNTEISVVIASNSNAYGLVRAESFKIPNFIINRNDYVLFQDYSEALFKYIENYNVDLICLAGFASLIQVPEKYKNKIMNIHPSLLPAFGGQGYYGDKVHKKVIEYGCKVSGCTVHFVDDHYDNGPIIVQSIVNVDENETIDSLSMKVKRVEKEAYLKAIKLFVENKLEVTGRKVSIIS